MEATMPKVFHRQELKFKEIKSLLSEFEWHTSPNFGKLANSKYLQFDIRSLDPGKFSFPYHFHRASEELFMVLSGEATLRSPDGFQKVVEGDIIFFEEGPAGGHQLYNHSDFPCVYLDIRTAFGIDVCEYPDSGKINVLPFHEIFESFSKVSYYKGEEDVANKWPEEVIRKQSSE
jgi:uncharacterized cupin superfamily protein